MQHSITEQLIERINRGEMNKSTKKTHDNKHAQQHTFAKLHSQDCYTIVSCISKPRGTTGIVNALFEDTDQRKQNKIKQK